MLKRGAKEEYKMKNKKGLSGIVTTLIIILLVIAAVGVIWGVVGGLLESGTGSINKGALCLEIDLHATQVVGDALAGDYNVTLERKSGPQDQLAKAAVTFYSEVGNSDPQYLDTDVLNEFDILSVKTLSFTGTLANATSVVVTPYFIDEKSGARVICDTTQKEFEFVL